MLYVESRKSSRRVDPAARTSLLQKLQDNGLTPLIRSSRLYAYEQALLLAPEHAGELERTIAAQAESEGDAAYVPGDVFCFDDFALFVIFGGAEDDGTGTRAGVIYEADTAIDPQHKLDSFCRNIDDACEAAQKSENGTGRVDDAAASRTGEWQAFETSVPAGFARFVAGHAGDGDVGGETAQTAASTRGEAAVMAAVERIRATELLEDVEARRFLRRLSHVHGEGSRVAELLAGSPTTGEAVSEALIGRLAGAGLVRREVLVSCRRDGRALFRLPSSDALAVMTASNATCSECGAAVADERAEEMLKPTPLAASMLNEGSWLTSRLRTILNDVGVSESQLAARPASVENEAHLMANAHGESFLFVLLDGDLTTAHARRVLDLEIETDATHLVVVATGKIQDEGRVRLREHARRRARGGSEVEVILVEGLDAAADEIRYAFERVAQRRLSEELYQLDGALGLNIGHLIATRFRLMKKAGTLKDLAASAAGAMTGSLREI